MATPTADTYTGASGATIYGGRPDASAVPSWVPSTAWQFTDVPGTVWTDYIKDNGTGIAPAVTGALGGYLSCWDYSGPTYSPANHEFWMFGGGHAGTTVNILTTTTLGETPEVLMACAPSTNAIRAGIFNTSAYLAGNGYWPDGKPYSPHSYENSIFIDARNEFISVGLEFVASSADGTSIGGGAQAFQRMPAFERGDSAWQPAGTYADLPTHLAESAAIIRGPRVVSADSTIIYHWPDGYGLYKYTFATNAHTAIGGTTLRPGTVACLMADSNYSIHADRDSGSGIVLRTCNLTTGVQAVLTTAGDTLPSGLVIYGIEYVAAIGKYVTVWIDSTSFNNSGGTISSLYVVTFTVSGSTATAQIITTTGTPPVSAASVCGMGYDAAYGCIMLNMSCTQPIKALKVA